MTSQQKDAELLLELRDLSKKAKQVLYEFHKKHEPNPILRWTRQAVWNWRRMDPGMMTRNALLLYAFFLADFHYNEAKRARELHHRKEEAASIKKEHAAVEGEVRTLCKQVESVLTRDGLYANTAWNSVRRDYGRFAYDISRDLASSAAAHSGKASTPGAGAATPPTRATPHGAGAGWGRFRYVNPYWWLGYDKPPQWMSGARNEEGMGICRDVQEQRGGGGESGTWGVVQEQRVGGGESGTQGEGGEGEGLAASKKTGVAGSEHATASKGERGEAGGRGDGGVGAEGGGMQTSKKKKAFVA